MSSRRPKDQQTREYRKRKKILKRQQIDAAIRAKYGPSGKPMPVTVRKIDSGEVVAIVDQSMFRPQREYSKRLDALAVEAGHRSYTAYLYSSSWRKRRLRALELADGKCAWCPARKDLTVHHNTYDRLGAELDSDLLVLCNDCHRRIHG